MALEIKNLLTECNKQFVACKKTIVGTINDIHSMNGIGLHDNLQEKIEIS